MRNIVDKGMLSIVLPCYNEGEGIANAIETLVEIMNEQTIEYQLVLIDDGSSDNTLLELEDMHKKYPDLVKCVSFTRNFGKEAAILAGLEYADGACAVVIDSDLQHPPEMIPKMYQLWLEGIDIVEGIKKARQKEHFIKKIAAESFYKMFGQSIGSNMKNTSDFKLIDRKVINVILSLREKNTFFRGMTFWTGFKMSTLEYEVRERESGQSKWSTIGLIKYAISNILSFSTAPLKIISFLSMSMVIVALAFSVRAFYLYYTNQSAGGITTVVILLLYIGGLILFCLSILGEYIAKIYEEIKDRPKYIVNTVMDTGDYEK